jgi:hypothetical protein
MEAGPEVSAFAEEHEGEIMLYGLHIAEYSHDTWTNHQPRRTRKLPTGGRSLYMMKAFAPTVPFPRGWISRRRRTRSGTGRYSCSDAPRQRHAPG